MVVAKIIFVANLIVLIAFFGTMPVFIKIQGAFNYYFDYTAALLENESGQVYDFIVGKLLISSMDKWGYSWRIFKRCKKSFKIHSRFGASLRQV